MASPLTLKRLFEFMRKIDELNISSEAKDLLIHYMTHQGESYVFHNDFIADQKGWSRPYFDRIKKELVTEGLITSEYVYENGKRVGTHVTVIYDLPNVTFPNVSKANVSNANVRKPNVRKANVSSANVRKPDVLESKKINREEENRREGENTHKGSCVASDAPAGAAASVCVSPAPSSGSVSQKDSKAAKSEIPVSENPPSQEDIAAYISKLISGRPEVSSWNEQDISGTAFDIWNHYTNTGWKTASGSPMLCWQNAVIGWLRRNHWLPEQSRQQTPAPVPSSGNLPVQKTSGAAEKQKSFKQMQQEWIERPLTDPEACAVEDAAHLIFNARSEGEAQGVLNSIPVHLRERALALANEKRKEQGDRPRIISPLPYEEDDS